MDSLLLARRCRAAFLAAFACAGLTVLAPAAGAQPFEGYGYQTVGGQGGTTYHVTNLNGDTSTGSLRWALNRPSPKIIVFDVGGTITLSASAELTGTSGSFVTIDGSSAPSPGITIRPPSNGTQDAIYIADGARDVIVKSLRFIGFNADGDGGDMVSLYGSPGPVRNVVVDHCTFENADDGAVDITEDVTDVTVSWNLFRNNFKTQLIKYGVRARLSIHHNVYASSPNKGERNPLLWGDLNDVDFVNNINYGWQQRGLEIRHEGDGGSPGKRVHANVVNNVFTHSQWSSIIDGLVYGTNPGPDAMDGGPACCPPQGAIVGSSNMGQLWVSGNILPPQNRDQYSTISGPRPVPPAAQVTTWPAAEVRSQVLPTVGTVFRTAAEQTLLNLVAAAPPISSGFNLTIGDVQVTEGNTGTTNAVFTVGLSLASTQVVTVQYATAAGTASAGSDYTTTSGTVTFPAGTTSRTVNVAVIGDVVGETNETFFVNLSSPVGGTIIDSQGQGTIVDDDAAPVSVLSIADVQVDEGNAGSTNAVFTLSLSPASSQTVTVQYATANGTATAGADYTSTSGTVTFPAGTTSRTVNVSVIGDTLDEAHETFLVNLSAPVGATIADAQGQGTIGDDDGMPTLALADVQVTEGNAGTTNAVFTVSLSPASGLTVTVQYATADGTATAGSDYTTTSGTVTFPAGTTSRTVNVSVIGDTLDEPNETFLANLSAAVGATIADAQGQGTITDDDSAPTLSIGDVQVTEGNSGTTNAVFTLSLSPASSQTVTVQYATADGTATAGSDYTSTSGTVTFPAGTTSRTVNVSVIGDTLDEPNETFLANLSAAVGATIADAQGQGTITDDDGAPTLSVADVQVTEGNSGTTNAVFTVSLSPASGQTVTVQYATADGTATAGSDYTSTSGTLTFPAGTTSRTVNVSVIGDTLDEPNETFQVNLSAAVGATIADAQGQGTITDDDSAPTLSVGDVTVTEGNAGTANAVFTVSLSPASSQTVTVQYATADGTATAGSDYTTTSGTLTFPAGTTSRTVNVSVTGDTLDEPNETFLVNLSAAVGATIADAQGQGTITDDDGAPTLSVGDVQVTEGNAGATNVVFTVSLSPASGQTVTVQYATAAGTATAGSDYTTTSGTLTFPAGTTSRTVNVPVIGDTLDEPNETFFLNLSGATGATIADAQGQGTITDDDSAPTLSLADVQVTEGNSGMTSAVFTLSLSPASSQVATVQYATAAGTATAGSDYMNTSGTVTFPAGTTSRTVNVSVIGDMPDEPNETFFVNLSGAVGMTIADSQGQGTIVDNDPTPALSVGDVTVTEGNAGSVDAVFTVSLANASSQLVTVAYATADNTAVAGSDYTAKSGVLSFAAGSTAPQVVAVAVLGDTLDEPNERFTLTLSTPVNAVLTDAEGMATILDDDVGLLRIFELGHGSNLRADLAAQPGPLADRDLYVIALGPFSSYEALVDGASGDVGSGNGPRLERVAPDLATVMASSLPVGTGPARSLRLRNSTPATVHAYVSVRSDSCGTNCDADDTYRIRARETTVSIPRFSNKGTQRTVVILQNTTEQSVSGSVHFWNDSGGKISTQVFTLTPRQNMSMLTWNVPLLVDQQGTITVEHTGRYGALAGKAVSLESSTGFSFDTPLLTRDH